MYAVTQINITDTACVPHNLCAGGFSFVGMAGGIDITDITFGFGNLKSVNLPVNAAAYPFAD